MGSTDSSRKRFAPRRLRACLSSCLSALSKIARSVGLGAVLGLPSTAPAAVVDSAAAERAALEARVDQVRSALQGLRFVAQQAAEPIAALRAEPALPADPAESAKPLEPAEPPAADVVAQWNNWPNWNNWNKWVKWSNWSNMPRP